MSNKNAYRVIFLNNGSLYELYAKSVVQSNLLGFIEIESILFGENSAVLVDPTEERLKNEFSGVNRSYIPIQAVIRIDEVEKEGMNKIHQTEVTGDKITPFPGSTSLFNKQPTE